MMDWCPEQDFHPCNTVGCSWLQTAGEPHVTQAEFHPSSHWELCASPWSGSVPLELSHTAGLGCRREDAAGTREVGIPACSECMRGFQLPSHPDCACKVARMQGHSGLLRRGTSVSSTPMSEQAGKEQPKWFSLLYPKEDAKLGPKAAQGPCKTLITLTWLGTLDFAALKQ